MPGDLRDPEQSVPFYSDQKYEPGRNVYEPGASDIKWHLQSVATEVLGYKLNTKDLSNLLNKLEEKGFLHMIPGSPDFRDEVKKLLNNLKMARKVILNALK